MDQLNIRFVKPSSLQHSQPIIQLSPQVYLVSFLQLFHLIQKGLLISKDLCCVLLDEVCKIKLLILGHYIHSCSFRDLINSLTSACYKCQLEEFRNIASTIFGSCNKLLKIFHDSDSLVSFGNFSFQGLSMLVLLILCSAGKLHIKPHNAFDRWIHICLWCDT